jgi:hypothetical protein
VVITRELLEKGQSSRGGWSREQFALLGITWPPVPGWPERICGKELPDGTALRFLLLRDKHLTEKKEG